MPGDVSDISRTRFGAINFDENRIRMAEKIDDIDILELEKGLRESMMAATKPFEMQIDIKRNKQLPELQTIRTSSMALQMKLMELTNHLGVSSAYPNVFNSKVFNTGSTDSSASLTVSNTANALNTAVNIQVTQTSKNDSITSNPSNYFTGTTQALDHNGTLTINGTQILTCVSGTTTINDVVNAINGTNCGAKAQLIKVDHNNNYQLQLTATNPATPIILTDDQSGNLIQAGLFLPTTATALDSLQAKFTYNGLHITRNSNTITDLINGATIQLNNISTNGGLQGTISQDYNAIYNSINEFISMYNEVVTLVRKQREYDENGNPKETAVLNNLSSMTAIKDLFTNGVNQSYGLSPNDSLVSLQSICIRAKNDGTLETFTNQDPSQPNNTLLSQIQNSFEAVKKLLGNYGESQGTQFSSQFSLRAMPKNIMQLGGKEIQVSITNNGGQYQATLSCPALGYTAETINMNANFINGDTTNNFKGIGIQFAGSALAPSETRTTTMVCSQGIFSSFYNSLQSATLSKFEQKDTDSPNTLSLFDGAMKEITKDIKNLERKVEDTTKTVDMRISIIRKKQGLLYSNYNKANESQRLLKLFMKSRHDD